MNNPLFDSQCILVVSTILNQTFPNSLAFQSFFYFLLGNPSPQSFSNYQCNKVADSTVNDTVYDSSCYRRLETTTANLDIITYRCQNYVNGELYAFDNPDLNNILLERFETDTFLIQSRNQYTGFIPPNNSFNLLATNETYNFSEFECEIVSKDGPINTYTPPEGETCEGSSRVYFCKTG